MATAPNLRRSDIRTSLKVLVELCSFENAIYEFAYTVDVSSHGARVLTKNPWQLNQHIASRSAQGNLYSPARVAYCQSVDGQFPCYRLAIASTNRGLKGTPKAFCLAPSSE